MTSPFPFSDVAGHVLAWTFSSKLPVKKMQGIGYKTQILIKRDNVKLPIIIANCRVENIPTNRNWDVTIENDMVTLRPSASKRPTANGFTLKKNAITALLRTPGQSKGEKGIAQAVTRAYAELSI